MVVVRAVGGAELRVEAVMVMFMRVSRRGMRGVERGRAVAAVEMRRRREMEIWRRYMVLLGMV